MKRVANYFWKIFLIVFVFPPVALLVWLVAIIMAVFVPDKVEFSKVKEYLDE